MGKYEADEITEDEIPFTTELGKVVRDGLGVLRASTFTIGVCSCCGAMKLLMLDEDRRAYTWIGVSPDQARGMAAALIDMAVESEQLGGGVHQHKH
jgi:hypothetical protein